MNRCTIIFVALAGALVGCAPQANQVDANAVSSWKHPEQSPGKACNGPAAPVGTNFLRSDDPVASQLIGSWVDGPWAREDGVSTGYCANIDIISIDAKNGSAIIYFGGDGDSGSTRVKVDYANGVLSRVSRKTPNLKYWMRRDESGLLRVKVLENQEAFYATLRRKGF